jgi:hypothetical protein
MLKDFTWSLTPSAASLTQLAPVILCGLFFMVVSHEARSEAPIDKTDRRAEALEALSLINADIVELNRIADYQSELIGLAKADRAAASLARRGRASCAERILVRELCRALPSSFPAELTREGRE